MIHCLTMRIRCLQYFLSFCLVCCLISQSLLSAEEPISWNEEKTARLQPKWKDGDVDVSSNVKSWSILDSYLQTRPSKDKYLHIFYVTFKDRPALDDYQERYHYILSNIQAFYADQMKANGFPPLTFALEKNDKGKLNINEIFIDQESGKLNKGEIKNKAYEIAKKILSDKGLNFKNEHIVIIYQLPNSLSPYDGKGNAIQGVVWVCDAETLAPWYLDKKDKMPQDQKRSLGDNSSLYMGGLAQEIGSSLGLLHTRENFQFSPFGSALMNLGNYHYGEELRHEGKGTFLMPVDALMLASSPLFNQKESSILDNVAPLDLAELKVSRSDEGTRINGKIVSEKPYYGLSVHLSPLKDSTFYSLGTGAFVDENGNFDVLVPRKQTRPLEDLHLSLLHLDGSKSSIDIPIWTRENQIESPHIANQTLMKPVYKAWQAGEIDECRRILGEMLEKKDNPEMIYWANLWLRKLNSLNEQRTKTPAELTEKKLISLVDAKPELAQVGWGVPLWDNTLGPERIVFPYLMGYGVPNRYIFLHAPATITFTLDQKWDLLTARVGMMNDKKGTITFSFLLDGKKVHETPVLSDGASVPIKLNVKGASVLSIQVGNAGDGNANDWGIIGDPELKCE